MLENDATKNDELMLKLRANVIEYYGINQQLKPILVRKEYLKGENMMLLKLLQIQKADFGDYRIEMIYPTEKVGVNEDLLVSLIGKDEVEKLKDVNIERLVKNIENKKIGERALESILTQEGNPYLKVYRLNGMNSRR